MVLRQAKHEKHLEDVIFMDFFQHQLNSCSIRMNKFQSFVLEKIKKVRGLKH